MEHGPRRASGASVHFMSAVLGLEYLVKLFNNLIKLRATLSCVFCSCSPGVAFPEGCGEKLTDCWVGGHTDTVAPHLYLSPAHPSTRTQMHEQTHSKNI